MWFRTQYGGRVALDVEPIDESDQLARYWINYDARVATAMSWRKQSFRPDGVGKPKYSTHFDTCPVKQKRRTAAAR